MPVFRLSKDLFFPHPHLAEADGLLAVGGDLSEERLLAAYARGIFPWYSRGEPILWWSPDPRTVLFPKAFHLSRSMRRLLRGGRFQITCDTDFDAVLQGCAKTPRRHERGTWIVPQMRKAYSALHELGWAHSVEVRQENELAGGLYGVSLGRIFFGESMFSRRDNASKAALYALSRVCVEWDFALIDCQMPNQHLSSLGVVEIARDEYLSKLSEALITPTQRGSWTASFQQAWAQDKQI